jgi:class 3 adenylate cyclase/tetratricopeptide (TPR) repeat protein
MSLHCPSCQAENGLGRRFCRECGAALVSVCPACGAENDPGDRFCGQCGSSLAVEDGTSRPPPFPVGDVAWVDERRLVSVLFVDLVGFTTLSEPRDPEHVRDLLSRYFERAKSLITRYGGTIEKFIGDAVVAVWGAPRAREDDAERAVRAGLELIESVAALGAEASLPALRARAGVVTGEASVKIGAEGEGMVVGDTINTASRIQSAADPGTVLVDGVTKRTTEGAIAFEAAGEYELKGKSEPLEAWRATRAIAGIGGTGRLSDAEVSLAGRITERQALIDAMDRTLADRRARLVVLAGPAGIGKSRLRWELETYLDGLTAKILWHRGRSLAYGDGVAYWAFAEMIRTRCGIAEDDDFETARPKLVETIARYVADPSERRLIEPRLATLLGLESDGPTEQADLFAGWRLFLERLSEEAPVALAFEDLHVADEGLLEFIDYLLEWSATRPIFILGLARPELLDRRSAWRDGASGVGWIELEPLDDDSIEAILAELLPGPVAAVRDRIRERAEGVPLYAVEMARMLIEAGSLSPRGSEYELAGSLAAIEIPESLQALVAARLDALAPAARRLAQQAAVLGRSFTRDGLIAVSELRESEVGLLLEGLTRKQIVAVDQDPYSAEQGQYSFVQALVQAIAYGTLSRSDRKTLHLRAAAHFERAKGPEATGIADVLAAHYRNAISAEPNATDVAEIGAKARETMKNAGERALSLAAGKQAAAYFSQAADDTDDELERAALLERAGLARTMAGQGDEAREAFERAIAAFDSHGKERDSARVAARIANVLSFQGKPREALERLELAFQALLSGDEDESLAVVASQLARLQMAAERVTDASASAEIALRVAERLRLPDTIGDALVTKSWVLQEEGRFEESLALLKHALDFSREHDLLQAALRAYNNLSFQLAMGGRFEEAHRLARDGLELARRGGDRTWEWPLLTSVVEDLYMLGRWDEALQIPDQLPNHDDAISARLDAVTETLKIRLARGDAAGVDRDLATIERLANWAGDAREQRGIAVGRASVLRDRGDVESAYNALQSATATLGSLTDSADQFFFVESAEALLALGRFDELEAFLGRGPELIGHGHAPCIRAEISRLNGQLAARQGQVRNAVAFFQEAERVFRGLAVPFRLAVTLLEHAEALPDADAADTRREEALEAFERLKARRWVERASMRPEQLAAANAGQTSRSR